MNKQEKIAFFKIYADKQRRCVELFGEDARPSIPSTILKNNLGSNYLEKLGQPGEEGSYVLYRLAGNQDYWPGYRSKETWLDCDKIDKEAANIPPTFIKKIGAKIKSEAKDIAKIAEGAKVVEGVMGDDWVNNQRMFCDREGVPFWTKKCGERIYNSLAALSRREKVKLFNKAAEADLKHSFLTSGMLWALVKGLVQPETISKCIDKTNLLREAFGGKKEFNNFLGRVGAYAISQKDHNKIDEVIGKMPEFEWVRAWLKCVTQEAEKVGHKLKGHKIYEQGEAEIMRPIAQAYARKQIYQFDGIVFENKKHNRDWIEHLFQREIGQAFSKRGVALTEEQIKRLYSIKEMDLTKEDIEDIEDIEDREEEREGEVVHNVTGYSRVRSLDLNRFVDFRSLVAFGADFLEDSS